MGTLALIEDIRSKRDVEGAQKALYAMAREALLARLTEKIPPRLRPRMDAEDVIQAAFMKAMSNLDQFQPQDENSFFAWVYRISKNLIADQNRRRSADAVHFATGDDEHGVRQSAVSARGRRAESQLQRKEWIDTILGQLATKEAEVIRLRWLDGRSFEEIAAAWKKTPGAVQRFHSRAWQRFRELAGRDEELEERGEAT
jgi:RNA polymerase sigma factor (sigma-70 family)